MISYNDFVKVDIRAGTIVQVDSFLKPVSLPISLLSILVLKLG
jgi:hypothetical protein